MLGEERYMLGVDDILVGMGEEYAQQALVNRMIRGKGRAVFLPFGGSNLDIGLGIDLSLAHGGGVAKFHTDFGRAFRARSHAEKRYVESFWKVTPKKPSFCRPVYLSL